MFVGTVNIQEKDSGFSIPGTPAPEHFPVQSETRVECVEMPSLEKLTAKSFFCSHPFPEGSEADRY